MVGALLDPLMIPRAAIVANGTLATACSAWNRRSCSNVIGGMPAAKQAALSKYVALEVQRPPGPQGPSLMPGKARSLRVLGSHAARISLRSSEIGMAYGFP